MNIKNLTDSHYQDKSLLGIFVLLSFGKIYFQVFPNYLLQVICLLLANFVLVIPFLTRKRKDFDLVVIRYFVVISLAEIVIIFYETAVFLKVAILLFLFSKLILLYKLNYLIKDFYLQKPLDYIRIISPFILSFLLCYFTYNNVSLDLVMSILIILIAVSGSFLVSYCFYFVKSSSTNYLITGILLITLHEVIGGYNFFNKLVDTKFVYSYLIFSTANYFMALGFWKLKKENQRLIVD